jgi:hypothetical protein
MTSDSVACDNKHVGTTHTSDSVSSPYLNNYDDWINYYVNNITTKSFVPQPSNSIGVLRKVEPQKDQVDGAVEKKPANSLSGDKPQTTADMQDLELVSPVQGAVQQARAEYMRAAPIKKKRKYRRRTSKKRPVRKRKKTRKRKRRGRKPVKRLNKGVKRKKKQKTRRRRKRDIFNE